jgi:hypothetical protein
MSECLRRRAARNPVNRIDVRKHKAVARHDAEATRYGIDTQGGGKRSLKLADDIWPI